MKAAAAFAANPALAAGHHPYRAPAWLPGAHLQTIWPAMVTPRRPLAYRRERWETPDGDFIDVDFAPGNDGSASTAPSLAVPIATASATAAPRPTTGATPLLVLFHGLEGSSHSHYALALARAAQQRGWRAAIPHFRGCSGEINRAPRAYHSGDSAEADWILRRFAREHGHGAPVCAVGVSLGGNVLLKWLGEQGHGADFIAAGAAISAPQDLQAGALALSRGFNRVYMRHFLATLRGKSLAKLAQHPGLFEREPLLRARDFFGFDDAVTAPMHGFASCYDYWERSSCRRFLAGIRRPALVINALNDPFLPAKALASRDEVSDSVTLDYPRHGGHVGFLSGRPPGQLDWLPGRIIDWLQHALVEQGARAADGLRASAANNGAAVHG